MYRFLVVTSEQIMEASADGINHLLLTDVHSLAALEKIKFKRDISLTLHYRSGTIRRYLMKESADCVRRISEHMANRGIEGN